MSLQRKWEAYAEIKVFPNTASIILMSKENEIIRPTSETFLTIFQQIVHLLSRNFH